MRQLLRFELQKIFSRRLTRAALLLTALLAVLLNVFTYQNQYAYDPVTGQEGKGSAAVAIDRAVSLRYGDLLTDATVQQMLADFAPKVDLHGMNARYLYDNAAQSAVYARFAAMDGSWNGLTVADVFGGAEIKIGYIAGWLNVSKTLVQISLVLALAIIVMTAPVFAGEYGGVEAVLLASRYGKTRCATAKTLAALLATLAVTLPLLVLDLLAALFCYGGAGLACSILFAPLTYLDGFISFPLTCGQLLAYQSLLVCTGSLSVAGITLLCSAACKNQTAALAVAAALYLLPLLLPVSETSALFRLVGLLPVFHTQCYSLLMVEQFPSGLLYALWALPAAIVATAVCAALGQKIFARHEVA